MCMDPSKLAVNRDGLLSPDSRFPRPDADNDYLAPFVQLLQDSLFKLTGRKLIAGNLAPVETARQLFYAPFVVLAHDTAVDPVLTYANQTALQLFVIDWEQMVTTPSRFTAELPDREQRQKLLATVNQQGFIDNYSGVRVSRDGRRFRISEAVVWNLANINGTFCGQAASFNHWTLL